MILVALSLLGAATVLFVLTPVFRPETARDAAPVLDDVGRELQDLEEKKLRLYAAIKDLDFEKEAGKVSGDDYDRARDDYLGQVAEILARIDVLSPKPAPGAGGKSKRAAKTPESEAGPERRTETEPESTSRDEDTRACGGCGVANPASAKFCMSCGKALDLVCDACGTKLPDDAKFCLSCGKKVSS